MVEVAAGGSLGIGIGIGIGFGIEVEEFQTMKNMKKRRALGS